MKIMKNLKVRDIMSRGVITVPFDSTLTEVVKTFAEENITGVVVVARDGAVMGVISEIDIVKVFDRDFDNITAEYIMSDPVKSISPDDTIQDAAEIMKNNGVHRLVIVHKKTRLSIPAMPVGILCASDIVKLIANNA